MSTVHSNPFILLRENISIYCDNHKRAGSQCVRACVCVCARARGKMHIFLSLQQVAHAVATGLQTVSSQTRMSLSTRQHQY